MKWLLLKNASCSRVWCYLLTPPRPWHFTAIVNTYKATYFIYYCFGHDVYMKLTCIYGIRQKEHNINKKFVRRFLIRNVPHFYGLSLDLCRKRIATLFVKREFFCQRCNSAKRTALSWEKCHNPILQFVSGA